MARAPQRGAQGASAGDDFYEEEIEGTDDRREVRGQGAGEAEDDAALDTGEEQETGFEEDLGADNGDDFDDGFDEPVRPTRGEQRHQRLANENRELRRQLDEVRRPAEPRPPPGPREETDAEFEARIRELSAEERIEARYSRDRVFQVRRDQARDFQAANDRDRNNYDAKARTNRQMLRMADRVEREFNDRMQRGQPVSRLDLYYWLRGQQADKTGVKDDATARAQARERVNRNTVPVGRSSGSDVPASRQRRGQLTESEARARRLDGVQI
ncbi:MAG TPA: hypothetical protein VF748_15040 [Candidatus Acidoferrum sp.]